MHAHSHYFMYTHTHTHTSEEALSAKDTNLTPHKHTMVTDILNVSLTVTGDEHHPPKHPLLCMQVCVCVCLPPSLLFNHPHHFSYKSCLLLSCQRFSTTWPNNFLLKAKTKKKQQPKKTPFLSNVLWSLDSFWLFPSSNSPSILPSPEHRSSPIPPLIGYWIMTTSLI